MFFQDQDKNYNKCPIKKRLNTPISCMYGNFHTGISNKTYIRFFHIS